MAARLIINPRTDDALAFELRPGANTVGRTRENDICVSHKSLSRAHARIDVTPEGVVLTDLGSKNGTLLDGVRVERRALGTSHTIHFGDVAAAFTADPPRAEPAVAPTFMRTMAGELTGMSLGELLVPISSRPDLSASDAHEAAEAERDRDRLRVLLKVSQLLSAPVPLDDLLKSVLGLAFDILDIDRAAILMVDPDTGQLEPRTVKTKHGSGDKNAAFSRSIVRYVLDRNVAALFADAAADPRLADAGSIVIQSIRTSMCAPLTAHDTVLGALYVDNQTRADRSGEEDLALLSAFACQAAVAIENAMLSAKLAAEAVNRSNLLRFFPPAALPAIMKQDALGAIEVEATALFCDISGYTEMSSRMKPTEIISLLNAYFPVMSEIVFRYEGTLEKYIGDALLAVWGAPLAHEDDVVRAVRAAIDMQRAVRELNASWGADRQIAIHIGVNSGMVAAGNIGSKEFIQYATIGDATNVASRICGVATDGEIVLGGPLISRVRDAGIRLTPLEPVKVKGKAEPLTVYRVEWE